LTTASGINGRESEGTIKRHSHN